DRARSGGSGGGPGREEAGLVAPVSAMGSHRAPTRPAVRALFSLLMLGACSSRPPGTAITLQPSAPVPPDEHVPDYAKRPFEPFSRVNAVAIAEREWRAFGSVINDAPPGRDMPVDFRPDRQPGLWQRVGDYWWIGQN